MPGINPLPATTAQSRFTVSTAVLPLPTYYPGDTNVAFAKSRANAAEIQVQANSIRWTKDGSTPATGGGHGFLATAGTIINLNTYEEVRRFRAIRDSADAALQATYFSDYMP